jgi:CDP-glucose 4,6-dehydratase
MTFNNIYKGKKVLITGNTGFKGSWLSVWLEMLGAEVYGYSSDIPTNPSMFEILDLEKKVRHHRGDIRNKQELNQYIQHVRPDFIFHLAAQAIVSLSFKEPFETVTTNVVGTVSVLESMLNITWDCTCVLITSDKVYDNVEWTWGYRENDPLGGKDIYSGSKGAAELIIRSYLYSFIHKLPNLKMGIARAGNVIGGGDWGQDRIVADCFRALSGGNAVEIRCPKATRPWQHVLEPLSGYLTLGQYLHEGLVENGEAFNFGPHDRQSKSVLDLTRDLIELWGLDTAKYVKIIDEIPFHEATLLKLNCDKALTQLQWHATLGYEQCIQMIVNWYRAYYRGGETEDMYQLTTTQINEYMLAAANQHQNWIK